MRGITVVLFVLLAGCTGDPATPPPCTTPDRAPSVIAQAPVDTPPLAQQQGISGDVVVTVTLNAAGTPILVAIKQSPSAILNSAALSAARASTYQPGLTNCVPGGVLDVTFHFTR